MNRHIEHDFIDICKGIAIVMVILVHSVQPLKLSPPESSFFEVMQLGCQIFFVLSGLTLCHSLTEKKLTFLEFMKRRLRRIVPGYWGIITCYIVIGTASIAVLGYNFLHTDLNIFDIAINLMLLNGVFGGEANNHVVRGGWFVGTMVILYLITPLLYRTYFSISSRYRILFPLGWLSLNIIICKSLSVIYLNPVCENNSFMYFSACNQGACFLMGFVLYDLIQRQYKFNKFILLLCGSGLFGISFYLFFCEWSYSFIFVPVAFSGGVVCLYLFFIQSDLGHIVNRPISLMLKKFGIHSYSIYLTHSFIVYDLFWITRKFLTRFDLDWRNCITPSIYLSIYLSIVLITCYFTAKLYGEMIQKFSHNRMIGILKEEL